jgi:hypothetical protein
MGQEAECRATFGRRASAGKAHLAGQELTFAGEFRLAIAFATVSGVEAKGGRLRICFGGEEAVFDLGPLAEKWALKIRYPRPLLDKLGVKPESRVAAIGLADQALLAQLRERCGAVSTRLRRPCDLVFFYADQREDLACLAAIEPCIESNGAIWVLWPKGQKRINGNDVMAAAKTAGLVDVKVCSVSVDLSGLKLMIPRHRR